MKTKFGLVPRGRKVVDLKQELVALDADMHYELADYLREQARATEVICKWIQF